ncbi:OsmC family protein [Natronolimnohabitans innermongolicus]|uniref:OsmC family protein n=1 Tax=Natronolimnohabitans innermongolicus JCM 12255 TaxID=1227499 RepID=L9XAA8_9EURY|nr:OsmC family protein [Natronolimnohabitans innermongolicus]ELY58650.1 OsmC family protein [Natronolimnohabitans innermongolicus JCM 12255]
MTVRNNVDVTRLGETIDAVAEEPELGQFTFRAETEWTDGLRCVTSIGDFDQAGERVPSREFEIAGDEPEEILGQRTAPNAVELLLAAMGSCLSVGYAANAAAMGIELDELRFEMAGDVDLRGFLGISEDVRPGYDAVDCTVHIDADASESELVELQERVEATSPLLDDVANPVRVEPELAIASRERPA